MHFVSAGRTRRLRLTTLSAAIMLVASALFSQPASAEPQDNWTGVWNTSHKFGTPVLHLELEKQDGPDLVKGWYKNDSGTKGKIHGEVTRAQGIEVWEGRFRDNDGASKGKFRVKLDETGTHFDGWFKACGNVGCSEKYNWVGDRA